MSIVKKAKEISYADRGKLVRVVTTAWRATPLPVNFDESTQSFIWGKKLPKIQAVGLVPFVYEGVITTITFKADGSVSLYIDPHKVVPLSPEHDVTFI